MSDSNNLLSKILYEAKSYNTFDDIEKLVDGGDDLSMIPIQPLYVSLINSPTDLIAQILPRLSVEQRQTLVDLDLWKRDVVDVHNFETWIEVYSKIEDLDLTQEFVESEDFLLYLKARINLHTFDVEDPMYPDHDYYFLTDDMLLLVEYSEAYQYPNELKYLIRNLYAKKGVEGAYTLLFKLVNDSFPILQEHNYQLKNSRLEEFGFVSYFEAIEKLHALPVRGHINAFVKSKNTLTPNINIVGQNQSLHSSALVSFDNEMEDIYKELSLVTDEKRMQFLHFTFIRLINSTITQKDALRSGRIELTRIGKVTKNCLELGIQYIKEIGEVENSVFDNFDFFDVYKVGNSLITCERNKYLKVLKKIVT
jgi:hypothetical protein